LIAEAQPSQDPWWKKPNTILNSILVHSPKFLVGAPYFLDQSKAVRNDPENYAEVLAHPPKHGGALKSQRSFPGIFLQKNALNAQNALHKNYPDICMHSVAWTNIEHGQLLVHAREYTQLIFG
jgi:hypothetical protein